jgi:thiol:disulfide interchange protein
MSNYLMDEVIPDAFEKLDLLGVPAVYIYDSSGERRYKLTGDDPNNQFTEEDVEQAVEALVREGEQPTE